MRRVSSSRVAVVVAGAALFVSLGGPAWAAGLLVGTGQIKNRAVTSAKLNKGAVKSVNLGKRAVKAANLNTGAVKTPKLNNGAVSSDKLGTNAVTTTKIADNAVTTGKLADNAVTSAKVADSSLTATDVAPNTFLGANAAAKDSLALGGIPANGYAQLRSARLVIGPNAAQQTFFAIPTGFVRASCPKPAAASHPAVTYDNASTAVDYAEEDVDGSAVHYTTQNNGLANAGDTVTSATGLLRETIQVASRSDARASTVVVSGHVEGVVCHFTAQAVSTG